VTSFLGTVRGENLGRRVVELEYEAYEPLAIKAFEIISGEVAQHWPTVRLAVQHRIGRVPIGETSIVIAAASPHRAEAFRACRYVIERVKQIAPIWKREVFEGGEAWVEGATADPTDAAARDAAYGRACG
jgi:molybdopterin synthase catalytic subunit